MKYRGLLFDLDGVFHVSDRLLPGAVTTLELLRDRRVPFRIVTNTTTRARLVGCQDECDWIASSAL